MAKKVFKDPYFSWGGTDLSSYVESATLNYSADTPEATASGDDTHVMLPDGLYNWSLELTLRQDFAASAVDDTLFADVGAEKAIELRPSQAAVASDNPKYTGQGILSEYSPVDGSVGDTHNAPVSIVAAGTLSRATS